jgi:Restriction endonuclease BglII
MSPFLDYIPADISELYEIHDYHHAAAILATEYPDEFADICRALRDFRLTEGDITKPGGSESDIPKKFSKIILPRLKAGRNEEFLRSAQ